MEAVNATCENMNVQSITLCAIQLVNDKWTYRVKFQLLATA